MKQWRENSKRYREKKKRQLENAAAESNGSVASPPLTLPTAKKRLGRRKIRQQKAAAYRRLETVQRLYEPVRITTDHVEFWQIWVQSVFRLTAVSATCCVSVFAKFGRFKGKF